MKPLLKNAGIFFISSFSEINTHFNGICYLESDIIVGEKAFMNFIKRNKVSEMSEGRFTSIYKETESTWIVTNDDSGQGIIYFYKKGDTWAISNSFLYLAENLNKKNIKLTSNFHTIIGFSSFHSTTEQLVSDNTMIREIKTLPLHQFIRIIDNKIFFFSKSLPLCLDYIDDLVRYRNIFSSRIRALQQRFTEDLHLDISGGYDSRTVFSLVLSSGVDLNQINFRSNRKLLDDFTVASELSSVFNFKISNKGFNDKSKYNVSDRFDLWKYGNLGIYFPAYLDINSTSITQNFQLHGAGGGALRGVVNDISPTLLASRLVSKIKDIYPEYLVDLFRKEVVYGAKCAGISSSESLKNIYYSHYRSRFHFGRSQYRNLYSNLITPLTSTWLYFINEKGMSSNNEQNIYVDLMLLGDKKLPFINFDKKEKNFSKQTIENSPFFKGVFPKNEFDFTVHFEKQSETNFYSSNIEYSTYDYMCEQFDEIISSKLDNPLIDKTVIKSAINEIQCKRNITKNFKILSFYLSIYEVSKFCSDLS